MPVTDKMLTEMSGHPDLQEQAATGTERTPEHWRTAGARVVRYGGAKASEPSSIGQRLYPDLGGDEFVRSVLRVSQGQPSMSIAEETEIADIGRTQQAGHEVNTARLHELQRLSRRSQEGKAVAAEISSALSAGDRRRLAAALRRAPGGSVLANRIER